MPAMRTLSPVNTSSRVEMLRRSAGIGAGEGVGEGDTDGVGEGDTDGAGEGVGEGDIDGVGVGVGNPLLTPKTTKFGFPVRAKVVLLPSGVTWKMNPPSGSATKRLPIPSVSPLNLFGRKAMPCGSFSPEANVVTGPTTGNLRTSPLAKLKNTLPSESTATLRLSLPE